MGIRPCTGALLVLVFANVLGLYWAGVVSTFVKAFGTFITVCCVAALFMDTALPFGGGIAILLFGAILFMVSLSARRAQCEFFFSLRLNSAVSTLNCVKSATVARLEMAWVALFAADNYIKLKPWEAERS